MKIALTHVPRPLRGTLVICVHRIAEGRSFGCCSPTRLESFVDAVRSSGRRLVALADVCPQNPLPERPQAAIIFDDGYRSVRTTAARLLANGVPIAIGVPTAGLRGARMHGLLDEPLLSREELVALAKMGAALVPHGDLHQALPALDSAEADRDISTSIACIHELTGEQPRRFVLPYGRTSPEVARLLRRHGIECAYGLRQGIVDDRSANLDLPRFTLSSGERECDLTFALSGWYGLGDRLVARLTVRR